MRVRSLLILVTMGLGVMLLGGVALAVTKNCAANPCVGTNAGDTLRGNVRANQIYGLGASDELRARGGTDEAYGGRGGDSVYGGVADDNLSGDFGSDDVWGGDGNDTISAADGYEDNVDCGPGTDDTAYVDELDTVVDEAACENLFVAQ